MKGYQSYPIFTVDLWKKLVRQCVKILKVWKGKCSLAKGVSKQPLHLFIFSFTRGKHQKKIAKVCEPWVKCWKANVAWPKGLASNLSCCLSFYFRKENIQNSCAAIRQACWPCVLLGISSFSFTKDCGPKYLGMSLGFKDMYEEHTIDRKVFVF